MGRIVRGSGKEYRIVYQGFSYQPGGSSSIIFHQSHRVTMGFQWMVNGLNYTINNSGNLFINGVRPYAFYRTLVFLT
jgi:hypothetical protein